MKINPAMCRHLKIALMGALATASLLAPRQLSATSSDGPGAIKSTREGGRTIFVNDEGSKRSAGPSASLEAPKRKLMYWSGTEKRWKPVPPPNTASMKAARSAAAEVTRSIGHDSAQSAAARVIAENAGGHQASPEEIEASIEQAAARHNVDPNLVRAVVKVESNFNPNAVSRKGAMGLMQLMPSTARQLKVKNPFDPEQNVDAGVRHLKQLLENYGGDVRLTLAAYNAGAGAVARSAGVPHYAETQSYVKRITGLYYGGVDLSPSAGFFTRTPVRVQRDSRGVLYISNTD